MLTELNATQTNGKSIERTPLEVGPDDWSSSNQADHCTNNCQTETIQIVTIKRPVNNFKSSRDIVESIVKKKPSPDLGKINRRLYIAESKLKNATLANSVIIAEPDYGDVDSDNNEDDIMETKESGDANIGMVTHNSLLVIN